MSRVFKRLKERAQSSPWDWSPVFSSEDEEQGTPEGGSKLSWTILSYDGDPLYNEKPEPLPSLEWTLQEAPIGHTGNCPACGDPMENGSCKRCDWGGPMGWSTADHPSDPTHDLKPSIHGSSQAILQHIARYRRYASKLDWILNRPDKFKDAKRGQDAMLGLPKLVEAVGDKLDPLIPWLWREAKKNRIWILPSGEVMPARGGAPPISNGTLSHWADWYGSGNANPTRRGVDVMRLSLDDMFDKVREWDDHLLSQERVLKQRDDEHNVHQWPDGWYLRKLPPEELDEEGDAMGHCVGGYGNSVRSGEAQIYSLRDPQGQPHVTMELHPKELPFDFERNLDAHPIGRALPPEARDAVIAEHHAAETGIDGPPPPPGLDAPMLYRQLLTDRRFLQREYHDGPEGATIEQIQGKGNEIPKPEYQARLKDWFTKFPEGERPTWRADSRPIENIGQFGRHFGYDDFDDGENVVDDDQGGYGPHGDYGVVEQPRDIDWHTVLRSLHRWGPPGGGGRFESGEGDAIYREALRRGEIPELSAAVNDYNDNKAMPDWDDLVEANADYMGAYPGESYEDDPDMWESPEEWQQAYDNYHDAENELLSNHVPSQITNHMYGLLSPHWDPQTGQYTNETQAKSEREVFSAWSF